ncbi:MAG: alpha-2-macroglobulin [Candidatus Angelobacter sp. Gp1-AA117]|nr:MAG: alpha-2-macroglobulin [Candidatus Angelobacter sp. Gp1-AA117]
MEHIERRQLAMLHKSDVSSTQPADGVAGFHLPIYQITSLPILRVLVLLAFCLLPTLSHAAEPYFSVSTDRTFMPGEKATVHLYTRDIQALEFRLYRVNDPTLFFEKLGDVHGFGHTSPKEQIDEKTWIERFHDWKHGIWVDIRNFFRSQFSAHSRTLIRESQGEASKSRTPATMFAQMPLLNSKQLVARWRQDVPPRFFSERQDVPIEKLDKGVYVIEATDGHLRAYTLLVVTELAVVTKSAPGQLLAFAVDRKTGAPIADTKINLWASKKQQGSAQTDSQGLALLTVASARFDDVRIIGIHDKDVALVAPYYFNISSNPGEDWVGYIYTDRPVYRPGHTVHFKGILRTRNGERYRVPAGRQVQVKIEDPTSKQVFQTSVFVSPFGSIHGDFTVPQDAALGYYSISVTLAADKASQPGGGGDEEGGEGGRAYIGGGFHVEEYKKPEYIVTVTPEKQHLLQGDAINATIEAKYYFGEPVANAEVKYVVHRSTEWSYLFGDQDQSDFGEGDEGGEGGQYDDNDYQGEQLSEKSGKLDAGGKLRISVPTTLNERKRDTRYRIEARITDESRREISGHNAVIATYGSFQIGVEADKYLYNPGEAINLIALAKDYDGNPVQTTIHAELLAYDYSSRSGKTLDSSDGPTGKDGTAHLKLTAREKANEIRIIARTPEGREVESDTWLWVTSRDYGWGRERQQVQIIPDKKSYKPGDTAHLLVMTNDVPQTHLLVTTEGRTIRSRQVLKSTGSSTTVSIPITSEDEPNVNVSVAFVYKDTLYNGAKSLKVPADEQKLNITVEPSQPQFKPGEPAVYNIVARDAGGQPVVGEFSLGVVDESIYAIQPDSAGDPHQFFYGTVYSRVNTQSSFSFYFTGEAGTKPMILAGGAGGFGDGATRGRLAQLKPSEPLVQPKVRKVFPDTALWLADIRTDQNGHAQAQLTFPDSLTTWRATVRGATMDTRVGSALNRVIVRKNLMVRLAVPRFFRQGDDVTISTIVHNYLGSDKDAQVSLDTRGIQLQDPGTRQVPVASKGEQRQDWHIHTPNVRESTLLAKALTNEESDALELTLPVIPFGVKLADSKAGAISAPTGQEQVSINLPGDPATAAPGMKITVSSSIAGSIFSALDYLTSYPYGCTEQTMSSFLPNVIVAQAMKDLKLQSTVNSADLNKKVQAGMERLYDFQHEDGGWGWWKEDQSMVFMTAYVVSGLAQAKAVGYDVKDEALKNAENWLKGQLAAHERMKPDLRAYVVYALALDKASDARMLNDAWKARGDMNAQGLSMLGLALAANSDSRTPEIASLLEKQAISDDAIARWKSDYDSFMEFYIDDSAETTAYALRFLSLVHPDSPLLPKAALWLVEHRDGGYYWISTKQTAMVIFGLTEYVKISHELDADFTADVFVNDTKVLTRRFTRQDAMNSSVPGITLPSDQLRSGNNAVRIQKSGAGRLYWSMRGEYYSTEKKFFQNNKLSLNITRDYYRLSPQQKDGRIVYNLDPLSGDVHSGDVIAVRLSVNGSDWRYLLVEDPIPAGAEFITQDRGYELNTKVDWWGFWFTRREFHDDHAAFFETWFGGHREYVYLLKIVNPGKFRISPASVQPMYQPSVLATTDAATMEVK